MNGPLWWVVGAVAVILLAGFLYSAIRSRLRKPGLPKGVPLRYTQHAKTRMQQRGVTAEQVKSVLDRPHRQAKDPLENSVRLERDFERRVLKVWVAEPWPPTFEAVIKSTAWHHCMTVKIPVKKKGLLIGKGGRTIQAIRASTGARVDIREDGTVRISADDSRAVEAARQSIVAIVTDSGRGNPGTWR